MDVVADTIVIYRRWIRRREQRLQSLSKTELKKINRTEFEHSGLSPKKWKPTRACLSFTDSELLPELEETGQAKKSQDKPANQTARGSLRLIEAAYSLFLFCNFLATYVNSK